MGKLRALVLVAFTLLSAVPGIYAEEERIYVHDLAASSGAVFRWDPYLETGELSLRYDTVRFKIGVPFVFVNYAGKIEDVTVARDERGALYFAGSGAENVRKFLDGKKEAPGSITVRAIIIDPGHGGKDPGAIGRHVVDGKRVILKEKDVVLDVAKGVFSLLKTRYPDKEIIMTRDSDRYISLEQRTEIANSVKLKENEAMIFVSIHANASLNPRSRGFEIWYLPTDFRRKLLDPGSLDKDLSDVAPILNSMLEEEFTVESILLAKQIQSGLKRSVGDTIPDRGLKEESWFVVRNAKMPAVLIELGFVTNKEEASVMSREGYLKKMSNGIYNGIRSFIDHFDVNAVE